MEDHNNKDIRQKLETYKAILLVLNWIYAGILVIIGLGLFASFDIGTGFITIIAAIVVGVTGRFFINIALAIPFILLNNGDTLESIKRSIGGNISGNNSGNNSFVGNKLQKKCTRCEREIDVDYSACPHCGNNTFN